MEFTPVGPQSRRNSITSYASNVTTASVSTQSHTPRDLGTDAMLNIDSKFIRKSRSKVKVGMSRSSSLQSIPRSQSFTTTRPHQEYAVQRLPIPRREQVQYDPQQQQAALAAQHQPIAASQRQQVAQAQQRPQGSGIFYFPNGEMFTPRQTTKKTRHRPPKVQAPRNQHFQHPPTVQQSPSLPNLAVYNQHRVPARRNPGPQSLVGKVVMTDTGTAQQLSRLPQNLAIPIDLHAQPQDSAQHEKRPSSSSSMASSSSSSRLAQISISSSSTASLSQLNASASPSPSQRTNDDTPASSINIEETGMNCEKIVEEPITSDVDPVIEEEEVETDTERNAVAQLPTQEVQKSVSVARTQSSPAAIPTAIAAVAPQASAEPLHEAQKAVVESTTRESVAPVIKAPLAEAPATVQAPKPAPKHVSRPAPTPVLQKRRSTVGMFFKKLFGGGKPDRNTPVVAKAKPDTRKSVAKTVEEKKELLPASDNEDRFEIDFERELKSNDVESVASYTANDERNVQVGAKLTENGNVRFDDQKTADGDRQVADENDVDTMMAFDHNDEQFLLKMIEVGETTFPDLGNTDLGTKRRKSLKMQKSLTRNSTISSQNSNSSMKTFRTSSSYLEDLDRMVVKFQDGTDDGIFNGDTMTIDRSNSLKFPSQFKSGRSAFKGTLTGPRVSEGKSVKFGTKLYLNNTYSAMDYDRFNQALKSKYQMLASNPAMIKEIRQELNTFKETMEIHELSRKHTQYFN